MHSDDVDMAIRVMLESFIDTQKYAVMRNMKKVQGSSIYMYIIPYSSKNSAPLIIRHTLPTNGK